MDVVHRKLSCNLKVQCKIKIEVQPVYNVVYNVVYDLAIHLDVLTVKIIYKHEKLTLIGI